MSLFDISSWFTGQDETARGEALDAQLAALNNRDYAPGGVIYNNTLVTDGQEQADANWATVQGNLAADAADTASYNSQVVDAAGQGALDGLKNVAASIKNPFSFIPPAWYVIAVIVIFVWIGGVAFSKGRLNK